MKQTQGGNYGTPQLCEYGVSEFFWLSAPPPPSFSSFSLHPSPNPLSAFNLKQLKLIN